jgi:hypothetical protein
MHQELYNMRADRCVLPTAEDEMTLAKRVPVVDVLAAVLSGSSSLMQGIAPGDPPDR